MPILRIQVFRPLACSALGQLGEGLVDVVEEALGVGFVCGGAALVVLVVAEGGLGIGLGTVEVVTLLRREGFQQHGMEIHGSDVGSRFSSTVAITCLFK